MYLAEFMERVRKNYVNIDNQSEPQRPVGQDGDRSTIPETKPISNGQESSDTGVSIRPRRTRPDDIQERERNPRRRNVRSGGRTTGRQVRTNTEENPVSGIDDGTSNESNVRRPSRRTDIRPSGRVHTDRIEENTKKEIEEILYSPQEGFQI